MSNQKHTIKHMFIFVTVLSKCPRLPAAVHRRQVHQARREIKDPRAAEDSWAKRAKRASRGLAACRATWEYRACPEHRDQR